jgi:CheY-like chemotaxis protein
MYEVGSQRVDHLPATERLVLVVEDDLATRSFLVDNFTADGFPAVGASGAGEGLRAIEVRQPSLVVLDLGLEDGNGLALLDRVRASDGLAPRIDPDLPVIVLSGRAGDADRRPQLRPRRRRSPVQAVVSFSSAPWSAIRGARFLHRGAPVVRRGGPHAGSLPLSRSRSVTLRFCSSRGGKTLVGVG